MAVITAPNIGHLSCFSLEVVCAQRLAFSIDFVLANFHDTTEQNKELIVASKEIILAISSQSWSNDNAQV